MVKLKFICARNPRLAPLLDGTVKPENIELDIVLSPPGELFYHNLLHDDFDVSEMSMSEYLIVREKNLSDKWRWSGLPVFLSKAFLWFNLIVNTGSGIQRGEDFRGKRVAIPDFPMTAALWMRIMFKELFGVGTKDVHWYVGRWREKSHGGILGLDRESPPGISLQWLTEDQTMDVMLDKGELDAAFGVVPRSGHEPSPFEKVDRYGGTRIEGNPRLRKFLPDGGREIVTKYYEKSGLLPSNHIIVMQQRIVKEHPWVAMEMYKAFQRSKEVAYERAKATLGTYLLFEAEDYKKQAECFGADPYPLGVRQNRKMLEALFRGSHEEGLTKKQARIEDVFHETTLDT
jgi:4,5-dihydroxyphthalate decarboxylase